MSRFNEKCIYNKNVTFSIIDKNQGQILERNLNLKIINYDDCLGIKLNDLSDYSFNYNESITSGTYDIMRVNQNLDINFSEFKSNLLEMLQQFESREMFIKCEISEEICSMIFYGRSKIKSLIFLTLDLHATNQKEILEELITNMKDIQGYNEKLQKELSMIKNISNKKDQQLKKILLLKEELEKHFLQNLKQVKYVFDSKVEEIEHLLANKCFSIKKRILQLIENAEVLKIKTASKSEDSVEMLRLLENLKIESSDNNAQINTLKIENSALTAEKIGLEAYVADLKKKVKDKEIQYSDLKRKNEVLHNDLEKATIIITQKKSAIEELSQDLLQANQMLVNFNKQYDEKVKQIEDLECVVKLKDETIAEEISKRHCLSNEFESYKQKFNYNNHEKLSQELSLATNKIMELENTIRKVNKINAVLTEKVNQYGYPLHKVS